MTHQEELFRTMSKVGPLARGETLTGPHHVGVEVDLEYQASYHSAFKTLSTYALIGSAALASFGLWGTSHPVVWLGSGFLAATGLGFRDMSTKITSRAVTEAPPSLKVMIGPTGGWSPVNAAGLDLPEGMSVRTYEQPPMIQFPRYSLRDRT